MVQNEVDSIFKLASDNFQNDDYAKALLNFNKATILYKKGHNNVLNANNKN